MVIAHELLRINHGTGRIAITGVIGYYSIFGPVFRLVLAVLRLGR